MFPVCKLQTVVRHTQITRPMSALYTTLSRYDDGNCTPIALHTARANKISDHNVLTVPKIGINNIMITRNAHRPRRVPKTPEFCKESK